MSGWEERDVVLAAGPACLDRGGARTEFWKMSGCSTVRGHDVEEGL
jgi:hypothetical protein